jgi:hypothetical protein
MKLTRSLLHRKNDPAAEIPIAKERMVIDDKAKTQSVQTHMKKRAGNINKIKRR